MNLPSSINLSPSVSFCLLLSPSVSFFLLLSPSVSFCLLLQTTGEAATLQFLEDAAKEMASADGRPPGSYKPEEIVLDNLISTAYGIARNFVVNHFPTSPVIEVPEEPQFPAQGSDYDVQIFHALVRKREEALAIVAQGELPELVELKAQALASLQELTLPANALDDMIDRFGGAEKVAEMTGRTGRVARVKKKDGSEEFRYVERGGKSAKSTKGLSSHRGEVELDQLNIVERQRFQVRSTQREREREREKKEKQERKNARPRREGRFVGPLLHIVPRVRL